MVKWLSLSVSEKYANVTAISYKYSIYTRYTFEVIFVVFFFLMILANDKIIESKIKIFLSSKFTHNH